MVSSIAGESHPGGHGVQAALGVAAESVGNVMLHPAAFAGTNAVVVGAEKRKFTG
jgi:hypothetical protein